jgi:hypothetical protein
MPGRKNWRSWFLFVLLNTRIEQSLKLLIGVLS